MNHLPDTQKYSFSPGFIEGHRLAMIEAERNLAEKAAAYERNPREPELKRRYDLAVQMMEICEQRGKALRMERE